MKDNLTTMLQEWSRATQPDPERTNSLQKRIRESILNERIGSETTHPRALFSIWGRIAYSALGAAIAIAVCLICIKTSDTGSALTDKVIQPSCASIPDTRVRSARKLFQEMEYLFAGDLRWISESNGDVGVGVEPIYGGVLRGSRPVLLRLVMAEKKDDGELSPVWSTDVIMRGQEMVEIAPDIDRANRITLWVYPLSKGRIAVDSELRLHSPLGIASRTSTVFDAGVPKKVFSFTSGGREYELLQTVEALDAG